MAEPSRTGPNVDPSPEPDVPAEIEGDVIRLEAFEAVGLSLVHAGLPIIDRLTVRNVTGTPWEDIRVTVSPDPSFGETWVGRIERVDPYRTHRVKPQLSISPGFLERQAERQAGRVVISVEVGEQEVARHVHEVTLLPPAHWPGRLLPAELMAGWVRPNSPSLPKVLKRASDRAEQLVGSRALCGYQKRDRKHTWGLVQAGWEALQATGIDYIDVPASFEDAGQKIRTPTQVVEDGIGTCLDLAVVLAALWEQMGLHPILVVVDEHAFAGAWLIPESFPQPVIDGEPRMLSKRIDLGEILLVDSSPVTGSSSFDQARKSAEAWLRRPDAFRFAVDVKSARSHRVHPLPGDGGRGDGPIADRRGTGPMTNDPLAELPERFVEDEGPAPARSNDRVDRWKARLLDMSLRNRLLNFRPGRSSAPLPFAELGPLEDLLSDGEPIELVSRPSAPPTQASDNAEREQHRRDYLRTVSTEILSERRVLVDLAPKEMTEILLKLFRSSNTAFQESGATTLYLALGSLAWFETDSSSTERRAPLVLIPVELVRPSAEGRWRLRQADEEPRVNVTLLEKLRQDFGLDAPGLDVLPEDDRGIDIPLVLNRFRKAIKPFNRWDVLEEAWLSQFSFHKFLMWLDLEAKRDELAKNPIVSQLFRAGTETTTHQTSQAPIVSEDRLDHDRPTEQTVTVMDADPSQLQAILAAREGTSFVLQGPPGTGKSQTITNLISQLLAEGRSVLFVSEKLAALDVVQRRLEQVGLGPFCLELHAHQGSKQQVVQQIKAAFEHANVQSPEKWKGTLQRLQQHRDKLNAHAARLAAPTPFGRSVRYVLTSLFGLRDVPPITLDGLDARSLTTQDVDQMLEATRKLETALQDVGEIALHPWRGVHETSWTPRWEQDVLAAATQLLEASRELVPAIQAAAEIVRWPSSETGSDDQLDRLTGTVRYLLQTPAPPASLLTEPAPRDRFATINAWVEHGAETSANKADLLTRWRADLFDLDLPLLYRRFRQWGQVWLIRVITLFTARVQLKRVCTGGLPQEQEITDDLALALQLRDAEAEIDRWDTAPHWLGHHWRRLDSDWTSIARMVRWAERLTDHLLEMRVDPKYEATRKQTLLLATDDADLVRPHGPHRPTLQALIDARERYDVARQQFVQLTKLNLQEAIGGDASHADLAAWVQRAVSEQDRLRLWCDAIGAVDAMRAHRLGPIVDGLMQGTVSSPQLEPTVERALRTAWWNQRLEDDPELASFRGVTHRDLVQRFRALEDEARLLTQQETVARVAQRVPDLQGPGDALALLRRELLKKRAHMPVRALFEKLGPVLVRTKPCVLMSPLSVAQFLDPSLPGFDVVVFDEASQIPPWDAIGAIARGQQAVIVGDTKQLPPTTFFSTSIEDEADEDDLVELESVLDEAEASGLPSLRLRWHYRSRHESLITFSNQQYYDNRLHTFPSALDQAEDMGVEFRYVSDGHYDRGGSRTNRREAEEVVSELRRLLSLPDGRRPTVGVVTFSMAQRDLVLDLVEAMLQDKPELTPLFSDGAQEPVFIKNLENVQGDERDVMLFAVGYGPDQAGKVTMNFGPLNRDGGERRLNVAITRARERLVVFSSLRHDMIRVAGTSSAGVRDLKTFLHYAEAGPVALDTAVEARSSMHFDSPFEEEVHTYLTQQGYQVDTQVGSSGYRIDLAVVHPDRPGVYAIAVECDGATYHGSANARERDRLRESVLTGLGWNIHRIWSTDWWYEPEAARKRLLAAVRDAIASWDDGIPRQREPSPDRSGPRTSTPVNVDALLKQDAGKPRYPSDYTPWPGLPHVNGGDRDEWTSRQSTKRIGEAISKIVDTVGPIHEEEVYRHVAQAWGRRGLSKRVVERCTKIVQGMKSTLRPERIDGVLWPNGTVPNDWRAFRPSPEGSPVRQADVIPTSEIANAAVWIVEQGVSMSREALLKETAAVFGLHRVGSKVAAEITRGIDTAIVQSRLREAEDGQIRLP